MQDEGSEESRAAKRAKHDMDELVAQVKRESHGYVFHQLVDNNGEGIPVVTMNVETALRSAPELLGDNRELVLAAVRRDGGTIYDASDALQHDRELVLTAVQQDGEALEYVTEALRHDREIVLAAVRQTGIALEYAPEDLKNDREVVMAAVQSGGWALQDASDALRNDREVVLAAVQQDGNALFHAPEDLKNDREVVMAAVQSNGWGLRSASDALRDDREVVLEALQQTGRVLKFASKRLKNDPSVVALAISSKNRPCQDWTAKDNCGPRLEMGIIMIVQFLKSCGMDTDCFASFEDSSVILRYQKQWKSNICERLWLMLYQNPVLAPIPGDIKRRISKYAGTSIEYRAAKRFDEFAPVLCADAQLEHPQIPSLLAS